MVLRHPRLELKCCGVSEVRKLIFVALLAVVGAPLGAEAKDLYVNGTSGNDATTYANNGPSNPWRTIGRAAWGSTNRGAPVTSEAARAGDTVIVAAGTYDQTGPGGGRYDALYNPANSGTAGNLIVFRAQGLVTLRSTTYSGPVIGAYSRNYIEWNGFYIDELNVNTRPDTGPVVVASSNGSVLRNLEIRGKHTTYGDNHNGIRIDYANGTLVQNNRIYNITGTFGMNDAPIMLYGSNDTVIENNEIADSSGVGIYVKGQPAGYTQDRTIIRRNLIYGMGNAGITLLASRNAQVYQNIVRDNAWGVSIYSLGGGPNDDIIANNTIHNNQYGGVQFRGSAQGWTNIRFHNNAITGPSEAAVNGETWNNPGSSSFEHNAYFGMQNFANFGGAYRTFTYWKSTFNQDNANPISTTVDPRYVSAAAGDFRLCTGAGQPAAACSGASPVLNLGVDILDLNNNGSTTDSIRPGAYIVGNETIGRTSGGSTPPTYTTPAAPTNVRIIR